MHIQAAPSELSGERDRDRETTGRQTEIHTHTYRGRQWRIKLVGKVDGENWKGGNRTGFDLNTSYACVKFWNKIKSIQNT